MNLQRRKAIFLSTTVQYESVPPEVRNVDEQLGFWLVSSVCFHLVRTYNSIIQTTNAACDFFGGITMTLPLVILENTPSQLIVRLFVVIADEILLRAVLGVARLGLGVPVSRWYLVRAPTVRSVPTVHRAAGAGRTDLHVLCRLFKLRQ